jgi:PAS domain S-box-containing protein
MANDNFFAVSALLKRNNKFIILLIAIVACVIFDFYAGFIIGKAVVYTHFFYIPIILAGLWYYRKAVYVAISLGALHVLTTFFALGSVIVTLESLQRAAVLGAVAYVIGFASEKRAKAEEGIIKERDRSRKILSTIGEAVYIIDRDLTIREVNRTHLKTFDMKMEEAIGKKCYELFFNRKEICSDCPLSNVFNNGACVRVERMVALPEGAKKYFDIIFCPLFDEEEKVVQIVCDVRDMTERKEMEEKLTRSERFAAIGEFSSGMAHELRQPLGVINNSVYFIGSKLKVIGEEKVKKHLAILEKEVKHANRLITDLLDFARVEAPMFKECDVNQVVEEVLSSVEIPSNMAVKKELKERIPMIQADSYQIQRVCFNLVSNAVSAMPEGGSLEIKTEVDKEEENIAISIADTGKGIPKENMEKVFEPLFTTKARGIGLGLSLCKKYVEAHEGRIEVESEVGKGTKFIVKLPIEK